MERPFWMGVALAGCRFLRGAAVIVVLAIIDSAAPARAAIGVPVDIGSSAVDFAGFSITSWNLTTTQAVPAGASIIVISDGWFPLPPPTSATCSDSAGHVYNTDVQAGFALTAICSTHAIASTLPAGSTITVSWFFLVRNARLHAFYVTGLATTPLDKVAAATGTGTSASTGPTSTTAQAAEILFGAYTNETATTVAGAGVTMGTNGTSNNCQASGTPTYTSLGGTAGGPFPVTVLFGMHCIVAAAGAYQASVTSGLAANWDILLATYEAAILRFQVVASPAVPAGSPVPYTVTALDQYNRTYVGYTGVVHFTSSDPAAQLPPDSPITNGVGTFGARLPTQGSQTITATDSVSPSINGTSNAIGGGAAEAIPTLSEWALLLLGVAVVAGAARFRRTSNRSDAR